MSDEKVKLAAELARYFSPTINYNPGPDYMDAESTTFTTFVAEDGYLSLRALTFLEIVEALAVIVDESS